jgi:hypothetical protein
MAPAPVITARLSGGVCDVRLDSGIEHALAQLHRRDHVLQELVGGDDLAPVPADFLLILACERERQGASTTGDQLLALALEDSYLGQEPVVAADARLVHGVELAHVAGPRRFVAGPVCHDDVHELLVGGAREPKLPLRHPVPLFLTLHPPDPQPLS